MTADMTALDGPRLPPASGGPARALVVLLHGVGADGNDLIGLAPAFAEALPDAAFVSPNAPFRFDMAPYGYQWFSIREFTLQACLAGVGRAAPILDAFLDRELDRLGLADDRLALVGFSQGTMMALHVGLRRRRAPAGILGYSGLLVGAEDLAREICGRPPVLLIHGEDDAVVPHGFLAAAAACLNDVGVATTTISRPRLGHGIDDIGIREGTAFLARVLDGGTATSG